MPSTCANTFLITKWRTYLLFLRHQAYLCSHFLKKFISYHLRNGWVSVSYYFILTKTCLFCKHKCKFANKHFLYILMHPNHLMGRGQSRYRGTVIYSVWRIIDCALWNKWPFPIKVAYKNNKPKQLYLYNNNREAPRLKMTNPEATFCLCSFYTLRMYFILKCGGVNPLVHKPCNVLAGSADVEYVETSWTF